MVLSTTLYLDFGAGIGFTSGNQNTLSSTVAAVRNIDGAGIHGDGTGPDLQGLGPSGGMLSTSTLDFRPLSYDFDGDSNIDGDDLTALADAVVPIVERALEPFDIDVVVAAPPVPELRHHRARRAAEQMLIKRPSRHRSPAVSGNASLHSATLPRLTIIRPVELAAAPRRCTATPSLPKHWQG